MTARCHAASPALKTPVLEPRERGGSRVSGAKTPRRNTAEGRQSPSYLPYVTPQAHRVDEKTGIS